jgi:hypothetical protein
MNANQLNNLGTLAKVGAATFCGAFFGAVSLTQLPTTLNEWKLAVLPALGAAVASELVFLRAQIAGYLAVTPVATLETLSAVVPTAGVVAAAAKTPSFFPVKDPPDGHP